MSVELALREAEDTIRRMRLDCEALVGERDRYRAKAQRYRFLLERMAADPPDENVGFTEVWQFKYAAKELLRLI